MTRVKADRALLRAMFDAGIAAAQPANALPPHFPAPPKGRLIVLGTGKAAAAMAEAVEAHYDIPLTGAVVTRYGYSGKANQIEILEAAHPVPDEAGEAAARKILGLASDAGPDDLVLFLVSGGGSALLSAPTGGITLDHKQKVTGKLLACGANIDEINCVRKHLSAVKGGRLASVVHSARLITLAISDVVGDKPDVIASGPTVPDPSTLADARAILTKYAIDPPRQVMEALHVPTNETAKPGDPAFTASDYRIVARPMLSLEAAAEIARAAGITPHILGDALEGEAREAARRHAGEAMARITEGGPIALISGGELTVTLNGNGRGGPNREYALSLALALNGRDNICALAGDSDGADGAPNDQGDVAGAIIDPDTLARARTSGLSADAALEDNGTGDFFDALGDNVVTGPTRTNVSDIRIILIR